MEKQQVGIIDEEEEDDENEEDDTGFGDDNFGLQRQTTLEKSQKKAPKTLSTKATDELFTITACYCLLLETFYQPFYPKLVTVRLHEDFMRLTQELVFKADKGDVYRTLLVLVRVDAQLADKDLREKQRLLKTYSTLDFGIDPHDALMKDGNGKSHKSGTKIMHFNVDN